MTFFETPIYLLYEVNSCNSYINITIIKKSDMDNKNICQIKKKKDRRGANNPMWGKHHSAITKQKQSDAAIRRYKQYKKALDSQHHVTMDEFLGSQPIKEYIRSIIWEEINKML